MEDEIMNIRKFFVKSFVLVSAMSALLTTGLSVYAEEFPVNGFYSYTTTRTSDNQTSTMYCNTNGTKLTGHGEDYAGAYKWVRFSILGSSGNDTYYTIDSREATGTTSSVSTSSLSMTDKVVRRIHKAQLHYSNESYSDIVDNYDVRINKAK